MQEGSAYEGKKGKLLKHKSPKHYSCIGPQPVSDLNKSHVHTSHSFPTY